MTDKIIKALECCRDDNGCADCPYYDEKYEHEQSCVDRLHKDAIDHIKRQQAEIEALINGQETLQKMCAEAYKRFAERLKDIYRKDKRYDRPNAHTLIDKLFCNIDDLVKEMTEGKNE